MAPPDARFVATSVKSCLLFYMNIGAAVNGTFFFITELQLFLFFKYKFFMVKSGQYFVTEGSPVSCEELRHIALWNNFCCFQPICNDVRFLIGLVLLDSHRQRATADCFCPLPSRCERMLAHTYTHTQAHYMVKW